MDKTFIELGIMPMAQAADHLPGSAVPALSDTALYRFEEVRFSFSKTYFHLVRI